jgi:hypothetical protein
MARDRVYTSSQYKTVIDDLKSKDVLGLNIVEGKNAFMLSVALGLSDPGTPKNKVGLFLNTALKTADKALFASVLLGELPEGADVDPYANFDASADLCEQCAETGYQVLLKKYNDAGCDEEILERRMIKELELLYLQNIEGNI